MGPAGQARISRAIVEVCLDGPAADVAARYLAGAGVACIRVRAADLAFGARALAPAVRIEIDPALAVDDETTPFDLRDPAARDLARGARAALRALRAALGSSVS